MPMKKIEISIEEANVKRLPLHVEVSEKPNDSPPDVIRCGDGTLLVKVGKYLDGEPAHYRYRIATVHEAPSFQFDRAQG